MVEDEGGMDDNVRNRHNEEYRGRRNTRRALVAMAIFLYEIPNS
jgi:hypothetical protein